MPSATKENEVTSVPVFFLNILILIVVIIYFIRCLGILSSLVPLKSFHSYTVILFTVFRGTSINDLKDGYDPSLDRCHDLQVPQTMSA